METDIYNATAFRLINSGKSLFVTGKAGTGKTTLLKKVYDRAVINKKNAIVLSPTGVAAKNAQGVTIHSFLHLPLSPYLPGYENTELYKLKREEIELVRQLNLIIIDEISMVRCDLLDMMDDVLRHYRKNETPFGGVQMVFFGDLYQLMPVETSEDHAKLKKYYDSAYFFSSKVYAKMKCPMLELKTVYRQSNKEFIKLLNHIRVGTILPVEIEMLMARYNPKFISNDKTIRLTTHNRQAYAFNRDRLENLQTKEYEYVAFKEGWFPKEEWPTDYYLQLKKGARVMFIRNDVDKQYVNGTLGQIIALYSNEVVVKTDEGNVINVKQQKLDKLHYIINKQTKKIETEVCGSFSQLPLRLAWAVTIHKSQGLTFDEVVVDAGRAFTYGQVYVALSRCKNFHGLVLVSEITKKSIMIDPVVTKFMNQTERIKIEDNVGKSSVNQLQLSNTESRTLWMVKDGLSVDEIVKESGENIGLIYSHLAKFIKNKLISVDSYLDCQKHKNILSAISELGSSAELKDIKKHCAPEVKFGEIQMVLASLEDNDIVESTQGNHIGKDNLSEDVIDEQNNCDDRSNCEPEDSDEWHFVKDVEIFAWSDCFLSNDYQVGMGKDGYYLFVIDEFIKLGSYPARFSKGKGRLSIRILGLNKREIVHTINGRIHCIGTIIEEPEQLIFVTPDNEKKTIVFEETKFGRTQMVSTLSEDYDAGGSTQGNYLDKEAFTDGIRDGHSSYEDVSNHDQENSDEWHFVKDVEIFAWSDCFLSNDYQVGMAKDGYYLFVIDEYIKLGTYPAKFSERKGWLSIRIAGKNAIKIVHVINGRIHCIGTIIEEPKQLIFVTPDNEKKTIDFE